MACVSNKFPSTANPDLIPTSEFDDNWDQTIKRMKEDQNSSKIVSEGNNESTNVE